MVVVEPCASAKAYEIKFGHAIDIAALGSSLEKRSKLISKSPIVLLAKINEKPVSIYASGRAMVKECTRKEAEIIASVLEKLLKGL